MKWFKHMSQANADSKIVSIRTKFGMWGVGCYWTLVEMAAEQMKGKNPAPRATLAVSELCSFFGCKRNKLKTFLDHLQNIRGMNCKLTGNILEIEVPKLLQIKDNYHDDLEVSSKSLPSIEEEVEVDTEGEEEKTKDFAPRKSAKDAKELDAKDFVLRLDAGEFAIFVDSVRRVIAKENGNRPNGSFVWKHVTGSMENDLKALIYKIPDEEKKSILLDAYKILGERMNWPKYVLKCIELTLRASEKQPIHKPYGYVLALLKSPQSVISATTEGTLAGSIGRGRYV
jgi:transcription elongation factor Elf1